MGGREDAHRARRPMARRRHALHDGAAWRSR
jgi:hypothetical protein